MSEERSKGSSGDDCGTDLEALADDIILQFKEETIAERIRLPLSEARLTYAMTSITVSSEEDFLKEVPAYYRHVLRHTGRISASADDKSTRLEALALLEKAFAASGGLKAACSEGLNGTHGGMRFVLDAMTEQMDEDMVKENVATVLDQHIRPLDSTSRHKLIHRVVEKLRRASGASGV